jgi:hypothetical protein
LIPASPQAAATAPAAWLRLTASAAPRSVVPSVNHVYQEKAMGRSGALIAVAAGMLLWAQIGLAADTRKEAMIMPCDTGGNLHSSQQAEPAKCSGPDCRATVAKNER